MTLEARVEKVEEVMTETLEGVKTLVRGPIATASAHGGASRSENGLMIAMCGLFLMLGLNAALLLRQQEMAAQIRRLEDYQMTTFMLVPKLREEVKKQLQHRPEGQERK